MGWFGLGCFDLVWVGLGHVQDRHGQITVSSRSTHGHVTFRSRSGHGHGQVWFGFCWVGFVWLGGVGLGLLGWFGLG